MFINFIEVTFVLQVCFDFGDPLAKIFRRVCKHVNFR